MVYCSCLSRSSTAVTEVVLISNRHTHFTALIYSFYSQPGPSGCSLLSFFLTLSSVRSCSLIWSWFEAVPLDSFSNLHQSPTVAQADDVGCTQSGCMRFHDFHFCHQRSLFKHIHFSHLQIFCHLVKKVYRFLKECLATEILREKCKGCLFLYKKQHSNKVPLFIVFMLKFFCVSCVGN